MAKMYTPEFHQKACLALNLPDETTDDAALAAKVLEVLSQHKETGEKLAAHMSRVTALETEVGTLKATNADLTGKLAAKEPIKLSRDVEGILHESVDAKLDTLVGKARITPAAAKKLATALKAGGAIMLSRDANGGTVSRANEILTALEDNDATELATLLASGSRYQRASLSRADPSDDPQPSGDVNPMLRTAQSMYPSSK